MYIVQENIIGRNLQIKSDNSNEIKTNYDDITKLKKTFKIVMYRPYQ